MDPQPAADEVTDGWPVDAVEVARIIDAWGVKGWIKLQPFAADPKALFSSRRWHLRAPAHAATAAAIPALLHVTQAKIHGDSVVAAARELTDRDAAHALRGASVFVARGSFPTAGDDEYYWVDLIGAQVFNRQGEALGQVSATDRHRTAQRVVRAPARRRPRGARHAGRAADSVRRRLRRCGGHGGAANPGRLGAGLLNMTPTLVASRRRCPPKGRSPASGGRAPD